LGEKRRLAVSGRSMDERQPVALRAFQSIEQPLPPEERKRERWGRVAGAIRPALRDGQGVAKDALRPRARGWRSRSQGRNSRGS
jgi:hypothetical protein